MKIAFIGRGNLKTNASTIRALGLGDELRRRGHDIHLFLPDDRENRALLESHKDRITFHLWGESDWQFPMKWNTVRKESFDVIHSLNAGLNSYLVSYVPARMPRSGLLILDSDEWMSLLFRSRIRRLIVGAIERFAVRTADRIIVASRYLQKLYESWSPKQAHYLPYAVNLERFSELSQRVPPHLEIVPERKLILYMGSFQPHFDLDIIFNSMKDIRRKREDAYFLFVGDGPLREKYSSIADREVGNASRFVGFVPERDVPGYLSSADVLVFPIRDTVLNRARCPNKIFQYMAARKPIVTNRVGEVANALEENAHYFDIDDQRSFESAIMDALSAPRIVPQERLIQHSWEFRTHQYIEVITR